MPRNPNAPRASEVHWLSESEKQAALARIPEGESFSNYVRRKLFKVSTLQHGGARQTTESAMQYEYSNLPESVLDLEFARGGVSKRLAENYRAAKSRAHRQKIGDAIMQNATPQMWVAYYQEKPQ